MPQSNPAPAGQPSPTTSIPAGTSRKEQTPFARTATSDRASAKAIPPNNARPEAWVPPPTDLAARILAQAQRNVASMEKHFAFERQVLKNMAAVLPRVTPPPAYLMQDVGRLAAMNVVPEYIVQTSRAATLAMSHYKAQQVQAMFQPLRTVLDDVSETVAFASTAAPLLSAHLESLRLSIVDDLERAARGARNLVSGWEILPPPAHMFPVLHVVNQFPPLHTFLPDLGWLSTVAEHMNALLAALPDWPPLDLERLKERMKQRLVAVFRRLGLCFAPSMSEDLMYRIADLLEMGARRSSITLVVWNYYARNNHARLWQAVERWQDNPEYARRWSSILCPAFQAHVRGEYGLSISALAPLVEGIASHVVTKNLLFPARPPRRGRLGLGSTRSVILRTLSVAGDEVHMDNDTTDLMHWVRLKSALAYVEDVFCEELEFERDYDYLHRQDHEMRRHGLLHGIQISVMTALNSLRLFLLLDTMYGLFQTYLTNGGLM